MHFQVLKFIFTNIFCKSFKNHFNSWSKWQGVVRPNFTWSKLSFFSWSKVSFSVDQIFWDFSVDRKIWSSAKKEPTDFGSWLKVLIMVFWHLKSFDQVPKFASYFLAVDQKFL